MTNEELIEMIELIKRSAKTPVSTGIHLNRNTMIVDISLNSFNFVMEKTIEALKNERPQGEWISNSQSYHFCSKCGYFALIQTKDMKNYSEKLSGFCPNCGAKMKGADNE